MECINELCVVSMSSYLSICFASQKLFAFFAVSVCEVPIASTSDIQQGFNALSELGK